MKAEASNNIPINNNRDDENISKIMHNFDLAITRSGANSISELAYLNVPF